MTTQTRKQPIYVNAQRIADLLSLTPSCITRLARNGKIPAIKIKNSWRFDEAKVLRYIEKRYSNAYPQI
ncbi:DNA binding domain-containing protein, excisionase family [Pelosinus propionicus DSM 13327]|uniref:DNA binding domain-containing protein, excisionase family n=2 Tax=Pelosinus TaxID=365348 RepID=A0A1I4JI68_9FIRM|nr:DNA binding domain-containing protein, excisionase family [Pelosinus propionicus DSM 13327]